MKTLFYALAAASLFSGITANAQSNQKNLSTCAVLPSNLSKHLVAYYPFCGNANDQSGNGNNPSVVTAVLTADRFGNANSAYAFDGSFTQYIKGSSSGYPENDKTVSFWFKEKNLTKENNEILGWGGGACGSSFFVAFNESNHPDMYTATGHCEANNCSTPNGYPPSKTWHNLIITSSSAQGTKFYLDGILIESFPAYFANTDVTGKDFAFGSIPGPNGIAPYQDVNVYPLKGSLDDIVIYDVALDSNKVKKLYKFFKKSPAITISEKQANASPTVTTKSNLLVYPNPSNGKVNVVCKSTTTANIHFTVYDTKGKLFYSKEERNAPGEHGHKLDLSFLTKGLYFLEVLNSNGQRQRLSFVIEK